jgi:hypothetical protein
MAANEYVGFYWTLPVNWAGFRDLPTDADSAAALSQTVRYQVARARRFVRDQRGTMLAEIAFCDVRHDRATDAVRSTLRKHAAAHAGRATLLYVRFNEIDHWRPNIHLVHEAERLGLTSLPLSPDALLIDGVLFDPARHFREWRERDRTMKGRLDVNAAAALRVALDAVKEGPGRWQTIAARLNADGVRTVRGGWWTAEGVRKAAARSGI